MEDGVKGMKDRREDEEHERRPHSLITTAPSQLMLELGMFCAATALAMENGLRLWRVRPTGTTIGLEEIVTRGVVVVVEPSTEHLEDMEEEEAA